MPADRSVLAPPMSPGRVLEGPGDVPDAVGRVTPARSATWPVPNGRPSRRRTLSTSRAPLERLDRTRADTEYARVTCVTADLQGSCWIRKTRESARIRDLDPIGEDLDPYVIACHGVRAVQDGIDQALEPDVARHDRTGFEAPAPSQRLGLWYPFVDESGCLCDLGPESSLRSVRPGRPGVSTANRSA